MRAHHGPHRVHIGDRIGVLSGDDGGIPDARAPILPAADFAPVFGVHQDLRPFFANFLVGNVLAIVGKARQPIVIRHGRQGAVRDPPQVLCQRRHDVLQIGDVLFVQHAGQAELAIAQIVELAGEVSEIVFPGKAGAHAGEIFVRTAEGAADHGNPGRRLIGLEGVFFECCGDDAAPAVEPHLLDGPGPGARREGPAGQAQRRAGRAQNAQKIPAAEVAIAQTLQSAFTEFHVNHDIRRCCRSYASP